MSSSPRKKVRIRWGRLLAAGGLVLFLLLIPLLSWLMRSGTDKKLLTSALSKTSGMEVDFDSYSLGWSGTAELKKLKVNLAGEQLLQAEGLTASFSWWSLLRRNPEVRDLHLQSPQLRITEPILEALRSRPGESATMSVNFENATVGYKSEIRDFQLLALSGVYTEGKVEFKQTEGLVGTITWDDKNHRYNLKNVELALLGEYLQCELPTGIAHLEFVQESEQFEGTVEVDSTLVKGKAQVSLLVQEPKVSGTLKSDGLTVAGHPIGKSEVPFHWDGNVFQLKNALVTTEPGGELRVSGRISEDKADLTLSRGDLRVDLKGHQPPFSVDASWDGTNLVSGTLSPDPWTLKVGNLNGGYLMRLGGVEGVGFDFDGELAWDQGISGALVSSGGSLHGQSIGTTKLQMRTDSEGVFSAAGSTLVAKQPISFEAKLINEGWSVAASGKKIPAKLLHADLGGQFDLTAYTVYPNGKGDFNFQYSGDKKWPAITGRGTILEEMVTFQELTLPKFSPAVTADGSYNLKKSTLDFKADLTGQELTKLWSESPVNGKLFGKATVTGTAQSPRPSFQGDVRECQWQGTNFGTVAVVASEGKMKATLADFSLQSIQQLSPYLRGTGTVTLQGLPPEIQILADFPKVKLKTYEIGHTKARLAMSDGVLKVESLQLPMGSVSGFISPEKINLSGKLEELNLVQLPLPQKASGIAHGDIAIGGTPSKPTGRFNGKVEKLVYNDLSLGNLPLVATFSGGELKAQVNGLAVEGIPPIGKAFPGLKGFLNIGIAMADKPTIEGRLEKGSYAGKSLPTISTSLAWKEQTVDILALTLEQKNPVTFSGSYSTQKGQFQLRSHLEQVALGTILDLLPTRPPIHGKVTGKLTVKGARNSGRLDFTGAGSGFKVANVSVGSIPQLNLSATSAGEFMLQADELSGSNIQALRALYPNLGGLVSFRAHREAGATAVGLSGQLRESRLPNLSFRANWTGSELKLNSLKAAMQPPVELTGSVKNGNVSVEGELSGQSLKDLMLLGGSAPPKDVSANLAGTFKLVGPISDPTASLRGPVSNMVYRTSQLGQGNLDLTVNRKLNGELRLNTPYDATLADAAPGSVTQVPVISGILKSALKARITAVRFAGTPSNPQVTPVVVGVGVANKVNLPTEVKLPDVQTNLPSVVEQTTGVKIPNLKINKGGAKIKIPGTGKSLKIKL